LENPFCANGERGLSMVETTISHDRTPGKIEGRRGLGRWSQTEE